MEILKKHREKIKGIFHGFDRMIIKGHLKSFYPKGSMEYFLSRENILLKNFSEYAQGLTEKITENAKKECEKYERPFIYLASPKTSKEEKAREIMERDNIEEGLICVLYTVEPCKSFSVKGNRGLKKLVIEYQFRKCRYFYYYFKDKELGFMHVRLQSWIPFEIQIYINGREYISRQLDKRGIVNERYDNTFLSIADIKKAQKISDKMLTKNWGRTFDHFSSVVNPILPRIKRIFKRGYYWCLDQCEYASDVMFETRENLEKIYPEIVEYSRRCLTSDDLMIFLGRKGLHGSYKGEIVTDIKRRPQGVRIKHRVKGNSIKMYDKYSNLRVETTITQPKEFKVYREVTRKGERVHKWVPMGKSIAFMYRYAQVSKSANERYLKAISSAEDNSEVIAELEVLCNSVEKNNSHYSGINVFSRQATDVFSAIMRGENMIKGFCNKDIRRFLYPGISKELRKYYSMKITRLFAKLRAYGLIKKLRSSFCYNVTDKGYRIMSAALSLKNKNYVEYVSATV
jgi:hypothetical protein